MDARASRRMCGFGGVDPTELTFKRWERLDGSTDNVDIDEGTALENDVDLG